MNRRDTDRRDGTHCQPNLRLTDRREQTTTPHSRVVKMRQTTVIISLLSKRFKLAVQVIWLVITDVRSESFRLVTERGHYNGVLCVVSHILPIGRRLRYCNARIRLFFIVKCDIARFLCAMRVFEVRVSSSPLGGYLCAKFRFFRGLSCWASPWRKIAYSLSHSSSLFDAPGTEAFASGNHLVVLCNDCCRRSSADHDDVKRRVLR